MIEFLFFYAAAILQVVSGIGVLISIILLISGEKLGFGVLLFLSFLISPLGISAHCLGINILKKRYKKYWTPP